MVAELLLPTCFIGGLTAILHILFLPANLDPFVWISMLALPHLPFLP